LRDCRPLDKITRDSPAALVAEEFRTCRGATEVFMPIHAAAQHATLDDDLPATATPGAVPRWLSHVVNRLLPSKRSAAAASPRPAQAHWYETPDSARGL
jgi:hypothetical protein